MTAQKPGLHPRNRHHSRYDLDALCQDCPELRGFIIATPTGEATVNFADPLAVKALNKALLAYFYGVAHWDIPEGFLCPPVPGRADYIHHLADLLAESAEGTVPRRAHALFANGRRARGAAFDDPRRPGIGSDARSGHTHHPRAVDRDQRHAGVS